VSSSSSTEAPRSTTIAESLERAFRILASDAPAAHREIACRLGAARVRITVDDEVLEVARVQNEIQVLRSSGLATVTIDTTREAVRDVLAGRHTLADALRDDALRAFGALHDLVAVLAALDAFVHGAVRCRTMPELFDEFQTERVA
jgi:hypothetical protein